MWVYHIFLDEDIVQADECTEIIILILYVCWIIISYNFKWRSHDYNDLILFVRFDETKYSYSVEAYHPRVIKAAIFSIQIA